MFAPRLRRLALALSFLLPTAAVEAFSTRPAAALADCLSGYGSVFAGYVTKATGPGGSYQGVSAQITNNTAPLCDTESHDPAENFNYTFSMLHQNNAAPGGANHGYGQVGFFRGWGACTYFTAEYDQNSLDSYHRMIHTEFGCLTANGTTSNRY